MRAGTLAGASAYTNELSGELSNTTLTPELKREIAKFSVNAAAIAASGGSDQDILNAFKEQAQNVATVELKDLGKKWVNEEILPNISDKTEVSSAPKSWENLSVVEKAEKVKKSVNQFKQEVRQQVIEKTSIDPSTIALT